MTGNDRFRDFKLEIHPKKAGCPSVFRASLFKRQDDLTQQEINHSAHLCLAFILLSMSFFNFTYAIIATMQIWTVSAGVRVLSR